MNYNLSTPGCITIYSSRLIFRYNMSTHKTRFYGIPIANF